MHQEPAISEEGFGVWRYLFALMVMSSHLWPTETRWFGYYAVNGFYMLSGYFIVRALSGPYRYGWDARVRYFANRGLRLYPQYWVVLLIATAIIAMWPVTAFDMNHRLRLPRTEYEFVTNLFVLGLSYEIPVRLVPPAFSLHTILFFSVVLGLLPRSRALVVLWFAGSVLYTVIAIRSGIGFTERYYPLAAASLPFSAGALLYMFQRELRIVQRTMAWAAGAAFACNAIFADVLWPDPYLHGYYASLLLTFLVAAGLASGCWRSGKSWYGWLDAWGGRISYPLFLVHWHAAVAVVAMGGALGTGPFKEVTVLVATLVPAHLLANVLVLWVERPLEPLRRRLRRTSVL